MSYIIRINITLLDNIIIPFIASIPSYNHNIIKSKNNIDNNHYNNMGWNTRMSLWQIKAISKQKLVMYYMFANVHDTTC